MQGASSAQRSEATPEKLAMGSSARARGHLAVLDGSGLPAAVGGRSAVKPVERIALGPDEWALVLPGDAQHAARWPAGDMIRGLGGCRRHPPGQRYATAR